MTPTPAPPATEGCPDQSVVSELCAKCGEVHSYVSSARIAALESANKRLVIAAYDLRDENKTLRAQLDAASVLFLEDRVSTQAYLLEQLKPKLDLIARERDEARGQLQAAREALEGLVNAIAMKQGERQSAQRTTKSLGVRLAYLRARDYLAALSVEKP